MRLSAHVKKLKRSVPGGAMGCGASTQTPTPKTSTDVTPMIQELQAAVPASAPKLYSRTWATGSTQSTLTKYVPVVVAQFNVLADGLCGMDEKKGGFTNSPEDSLNWDFRKHRLLEELLRHGDPPDIIALEEVDHYADWFYPNLGSLGYDGKFLAKPNSRCKASLNTSLEDGCAIFWRKDRLQCLHTEFINYEAKAADGSLAIDKSNQVAVIATLQTHDGFVMNCAVTHLAAKKNQEGEEIRAYQLGQLLDFLHKKGLPCLVATDMNASPQPTGASDYPSQAYPSALGHDLQLRSAYMEALGTEPVWTSWKRRGEQDAKYTIDYIMFSKPFEVLEVLLPPIDDVVEPGRLPGWSYPSDHVSLIAKLALPARGAACNNT